MIIIIIVTSEIQCNIVYSLGGVRFRVGYTQCIQCNCKKNHHHHHHHETITLLSSPPTPLVHIIWLRCYFLRVILVFFVFFFCFMKLVFALLRLRTKFQSPLNSYSKHLTHTENWISTTNETKRRRRKKSSTVKEEAQNKMF